MAGDGAAWAQAWISGAAIIISGAIAVFVPWNERRLTRRREDRARLDVDCRVSVDGGLELLIGYRPEFHHQALSVGVSLLEPDDARVYKGVFEGGSADQRPTGKKGSLATNLRYNGVGLARRPQSGASNLYQCFLFIEYPDERRGPNRARIRIDVLTHGNHLIAQHTMYVTPMDAEFWPNGAPHVLLDVRK